MHPEEPSILAAIITAAAVLLILCIFLSASIIVYHRRKVNMYRERLAERMLSFEQEQACIALDLHDDIGNELSALRMEIETGGSTAGKLAQHTGQIIQKLRRLTFHTMPAILQQSGLYGALLELTAGAPLQVQLQCKAIGLPPGVQVHLFRMAQEMFANTLKHAGATTVVINIYPAGNKIIFRYKDNGKGFARDKIITSTHGHGIRNIQARAELLNAALYLLTKPDHGVTYHIEICR